MNFQNLPSRSLLTVLLFLGLSFSALTAQADLLIPPGSILLAQEEGDDSYDPFADYSEFDEASDEEADINFFRNGRFLTIGFLAGMRSFTGNLGDLYSSNMDYGIFLSYFFDLRFALQFGYANGDHKLYVKGDEPVRGAVSLSRISFNLKYYMNTQNVTRGLASLNPYIIGGISSHSRTYTVNGEDGFSKDDATGIDIGTGIEIPMMRNKMFFGVQALFQMVNFKDEQTELQVTDGGTGVYPSGDIFEISGILGINF